MRCVCSHFFFLHRNIFPLLFSWQIKKNQEKYFGRFFFSLLFCVLLCCIRSLSCTLQYTGIRATVWIDGVCVSCVCLYFFYRPGAWKGILYASMQRVRTQNAIKYCAHMATGSCPAWPNILMLYVCWGGNPDGGDLLIYTIFFFSFIQALSFCHYA